MPENKNSIPTYCFASEQASSGHSGAPLTMDVQSASTAPGAPVIIWPVSQNPFGGASNQNFQVVGPAPDNSYQIVNVNSGLYIEVPGSSLADNVQLTQARGQAGVDNQYFYFNDPNSGQHMAPIGGGIYNIVNKHSGKAIGLDITDNKGFHQGDRVVQGGTATTWTLLVP
jgi:hypothetical protein